MQDRLTYANGNTITTEGFRCSVGEPIDIKVTVGEDEEVNLQGEAGKIITYGDYLITLEVNGEKAAYRDLYHLGDPVTVGDYTISDDMYLDGVSEGDEVVMRLEPVELMVTDAFRAAVKSLGGAASDSSGGGSGGGVLVVNVVYDEEKDNDYTDKTWKEIYDAPMAVRVEIDSLPDGDTYKAYYLVSAVEHKGNGEYSVYFYDYIENPKSGEITIQKVRLVTDSENGYLTYAE